MRVIGPSIAYVTLTKGMFALIDSDDIPIVGTRNWSARKGWKQWYAAAKIDGKGKTIHQFILGFPDSDIDHINGCGLDNRRANLRLATKQRNAYNIGVRPGTASGYKGVHPNKERWQAQITHEGKLIHLGLFRTPQEAYAAYCGAAHIIHGEFFHGFMTLPEG